jgi:hypothetical protein
MLKKSVYMWDSASIPRHVHEHLVRDIGPKAFAEGGDLVLRAPLARSLSRGSPVHAVQPPTPDAPNVIRFTNSKDG